MSVVILFAQREKRTKQMSFVRFLLAFFIMYRGT